MFSFQRMSYAQLVKLASIAAMLVAGTLFAIKLIAWFFTDSAALLASVTDSSLDLFISGLNFFIIRIALKPADDDHRFGHGKAEQLAALAQGAFVCGSAILLAIHGVERSFSSQPLQHSELGIAASAVAFVFTGFLILLQRKVVQQTNSPAIKADMLHYTSDLGMNAAVLVALILTANGVLWIDGLLTLAIAIYLAIGAVGIIRESIDQLMDKELDEPLLKDIQEIATQNKLVKGVHELRTRRSGATIFIQMHLELPGAMALADVHEISESVEVQLREHFSDELDVTIHFDPV